MPFTVKKKLLCNGLYRSQRKCPRYFEGAPEEQFEVKKRPLNNSGAHFAFNISVNQNMEPMLVY